MGHKMNSDALLASMFGFGLGFPTLAVGLWQLRREIAPRCWLKVPGLVITATIDKQATGRGGCQFVPEVQYEYYCDDHVLRSSRRRFGNYVSGRKDSAEAICSRYPAGGNVTVLIDPKHHERAVLEYGPTPLSWISIAFGILFSALGFFALVSK
jgi:hypothetical protein